MKNSSLSLINIHCETIPCEKKGKVTSVSKAFTILDCETMKEKLEWRRKAKKLRLKFHPDKNLSSSIEENKWFTDRFIDVTNAQDFLIDYQEKLNSCFHETLKVFLSWIVFSILIKTLKRRTKKTEKEDDQINNQKLSLGNERILVFVVNSINYLMDEVFLIWWVLSIRKLSL